jgi:N-acetylglucosaminyl-diphospho-decaprenol L-rhamnosyltransferase
VSGPHPALPQRGRDKSTDLSVIVVNWNTCRLLEACLRSVDAARQDLAVEVLVVDNGSSDGSVELVRKGFPSDELIANAGNRGYAAANNQGVERARGRYLLLLNSDTEVDTAALRTLVAYADDHPEAGVIGPKLLNPDGSLQPSGGRFPTPVSTVASLLGLHRLTGRPRYGTERNYSVPAEVDEVSGAAMLIRREVVAQVGGLDEGFAWGYEDVDYCLRVRRAGWRVQYVPDARVMHHWGGTQRLAPAPTVLKAIAGRRRYFEKHYGRLTASLVMAGTVVSHGLRLVAFAIAGLGNPKRRTRAATEWAILRGILSGRT